GSTWSPWLTYDALNPTVAWTVTNGDGLKTIYFQTQDYLGQGTQFSNAVITLDTTLPSKPSFLNRTVSCSGSNRTVNLSWGISNDTNFTGYRVYRSTDGVTWSALLTTSSTAASDTHKKALDSVRYKVVGYDKAGNESLPTAIVSLVKNQCS